MANLSKIKREKMIKYLEELKKMNDDEENIRAITEIENALNEKKYGLVWEEHSEKVDEMLEHNIPIFVEDEKRKIVVDEEKGYNFLLEGDNLHSLKLLEKTHKGKIDVIYIDPPYNTGNKDFVYDDSFIDKTDGYAHSKWLSFMEKRLVIARELLSKEGVIFISIDDNEQAQLKLLCDEIFGEENFYKIIAVEMSKTQGMKVKSAQKGEIVKNKEFIFVYAKSINHFKLKTKKPLYENIPYYDTHFSYYVLDKDKKIEKLVDVLKNNNNIKYEINKLENIKNFSLKNLDFFIQNSEIIANFILENLDVIYSDGNADINIPQNILSKINSITFTEFLSEDNKIYKLLKTGNGNIRQLIPLSSTYNISDDFYPKYGRSVIKGDFWKEFSLDMGNINKEGNIEFKNGKKPIRLIKQLLKWLNSNNCMVLDFFAGSGTTGHAVMQLNKEDEGNRKYILCTNNENNICEKTTYQRIKNIQEELPHNLKYYKTDFIPKFSDTEESISDKMMKNIKELIELEYAIEVDEKKYIIVNDEDKLDEIISKIENDGKLFISSGIFLSRSNQRILEEKRVNIIEIPEYYFREELKEVGEL